MMILPSTVESICPWGTISSVFPKPIFRAKIWAQVAHSAKKRWEKVLNINSDNFAAVKIVEETQEKTLERFNAFTDSTIEKFSEIISSVYAVALANVSQGAF